MKIKQLCSRSHVELTQWEAEDFQVFKSGLVAFGIVFSFGSTDPLLSKILIKKMKTQVWSDDERAIKKQQLREHDWFAILHQWNLISWNLCDENFFHAIKDSDRVW